MTELEGHTLMTTIGCPNPWFSWLNARGETAGGTGCISLAGSWWDPGLVSLAPQSDSSGMRDETMHSCKSHCGLEAPCPQCLLHLQKIPNPQRDVPDINNLHTQRRQNWDFPPWNVLLIPYNPSPNAIYQPRTLPPYQRCLVTRAA